MDTERIQEITRIQKTQFHTEKLNPSKDEDTTPQDKLTEQSKEGISDSPKKKLPTTKLPRCQLTSCNKKIGYTGYPCHCRQTFCATHRFAKEHGCSYDYKQTERALLEKKNGSTGLAYTKVTKI